MRFSLFQWKEVWEGKTPTVYEATLQFRGGSVHRYAHGPCVLDDVDFQNLEEDDCCICGAENHTGRLNEKLLKIELGRFVRGKKGPFVQFLLRPDLEGVVHWSCARTMWNKDVTRGLPVR